MTQPLASDPRAVLSKLAIAAHEQTRDPSIKDVLHEAHDCLEEMLYHCERLTEERNMAIREASHWSNRFVDTNRKLEKTVEQQKEGQRKPPPDEGERRADSAT